MLGRGRRRSRRLCTSFAVYVFAFTIVLWHIGACVALDDDSFRESLTMRPLSDGRLHALFSFDVTSPWDAASAASIPTYSYVPRSLVHVALGSEADEIHLAINAGRWNYDLWGIPVAEQMVGTGAEVRAKLRTTTTNKLTDDQKNEVPLQSLTNWRKLTADLAGLFCASLDALDERMTVLPFEQRRNGSSDTVTLKAMLSSESICTENLSTLLKLLPCKSMAGLATLLKPHQFFLADFHGLALHMVRTASGWNMKINVQAVFSPALTPAVRSKRDWSFERLFGSRLKQSCPLVDSSSVTVLAPPRREDEAYDDDGATPTADFRVWPIVMHPADTRDIDENEELTATDKLLTKAERFAVNLGKKGFFTFDTRQSTDLNVEMQWPSENVFHYPTTHVKQKITASRILSGYGQERGTVELTVRNNDATQTRTVVYHEILPWFVKPYLHTFTATVLPDEYDEDEDNVVRFADDVSGPALVQLNYTPSVPRAKPFHLQARLQVAPQSTVQVVFEYDKAFMRFAEHPPDAHRGFDVAPAVVELEDGSLLYTEPALVEVAVPDFSMPYNVIIFTSTLIALCAGSTLNNLIRKYSDVVELEPTKDTSRGT